MLYIVSIGGDESGIEKVAIQCYRQGAELLAGNDAGDRRAHGLVIHRLLAHDARRNFRIGGGGHRQLFQRRQNHSLVAYVDGDAAAQVHFAVATLGAQGVVLSRGDFGEVVGAVGVGDGGAGHTNGRVLQRHAHARCRITSRVVHHAVQHGILSSSEKQRRGRHHQQGGDTNQQTRIPKHVPSLRSHSVQPWRRLSAVARAQ